MSKVKKQYGDDIQFEYVCDLWWWPFMDIFINEVINGKANYILANIHS